MVPNIVENSLSNLAVARNRGLYLKLYPLDHYLGENVVTTRRTLL